MILFVVQLYNKYMAFLSHSSAFCIIALLLVVMFASLLAFIVIDLRNSNPSYSLTCNITGQINNDTWSYSVWKNINDSQIFCTRGRCAGDGAGACNQFNDTTCTKIKGLSQCLN